MPPPIVKPEMTVSAPKRKISYNSNRQPLNRPQGSDSRRSQDHDSLEEKVIQVNRVSKKTKGGNRISFSVLMAVGDKKGRVGIGLGKAPDVLSAIKKGSRKARNKLLKVPLKDTTIPFEMRLKRGASRILLKPAPPGTGIIAGGPVRAVVELAGIRDIVAKILGTRNKLSNVYTTFAALEKIRDIYHLKSNK